jgi:hypothetical protein
MSPDERDSADNLMLLCRDDHDEIDRAGSLDIATIEFLRATKASHEEQRRLLQTTVAQVPQHAAQLSVLSR